MDLAEGFACSNRGLYNGTIISADGGTVEGRTRSNDSQVLYSVISSRGQMSRNGVLQKEQSEKGSIFGCGGCKVPRDENV